MHPDVKVFGQRYDIDERVHQFIQFDVTEAIEKTTIATVHARIAAQDHVALSPLKPVVAEWSRETHEAYTDEETGEVYPEWHSLRFTYEVAAVPR